MSADGTNENKGGQSIRTSIRGVTGDTKTIINSGLDAHANLARFFATHLPILN